MSKSPAPVYEEVEPVNIQHPDLIEELQRQLEDSLENNVEETVNVENDVTNPKYWVSHINYDLDELMTDL